MEPPAYYYMPLFKPGAIVHKGSSQEKVSHVMVRRNTLLVYLVGHDAPVTPDLLQLAPTAFHLRRMP